jgi:hypothetical protein
VIVLLFVMVTILVVVRVVRDRLVDLFGEKVGLGEQQNGDRNQGSHQENVLNGTLTGIHRFVNGTGVQGNVDEGGNQVGRLASVARAAKVQLALVGRGINGTIDTAGETPRSTSTVTFVGAFSPDKIRVFTPSVAFVGNAGSGKHASLPINDPLEKDQTDHL